jgi:antitoxin MazE
MQNVIKTHLVQVGNSRGVRIPGVLIKQLGLTDEIEMAVERGNLVIHTPHKPRRGWAGRFRKMTEQKDDQSIIDDSNLSTWDEKEWQW